MFQQEHTYGFSIVETSLSYEPVDYFQNVTVSGSESHLNSLSSSSSATLSCSIAKEQSHSTENLFTLRPRAQGGSVDHPSQKRWRKRRTRSDKKIEDKENQRLNHIILERNRRRNMNHFLTILKAMLPLSYSQPGNQASIIEGTINYLKKQEQLLQSLKAAQLKTTKPITFSDLFISPDQYSTATTSSSNHHHHKELLSQAAVAEVEITMLQRYANIKVLTKKRPKLLFKIVKEFNSLGLNTLHLNLTTFKDMSLFTFIVKVEEDCRLTTIANEVANAVHDVVRRIHKER